MFTLKLSTFSCLLQSIRLENVKKIIYLCLLILKSINIKFRVMLMYTSIKKLVEVPVIARGIKKTFLKNSILENNFFLLYIMNKLQKYKQF